MTTTSATPGKRLRELRHRCGVSLREVQQHADYDASHISMIERGKRGCDDELAVWLTRAICLAAEARHRQLMDAVVADMNTATARLASSLAVLSEIHAAD